MAGTIRDAYIANALTELENDDVIPIGEYNGGSYADGGISASDLLAQIGSGWVKISATATSGTLDSPSFEISFDADMTGLIGLGDRIKITQSTVKYFIVTKVGAFGGGATIITCYGGTDYALVASGTTAITLPYFSHAKSPLGFPQGKDKWSVLVSNLTDYTITSPSVAWHSAMDSGSLPSIDIPIGAWSIFYKVSARVEDNTAGYARIDMTLSTTTSTETWADISTSYSINAGLSGAGVLVNKPTAISPVLHLEIATKDTYNFLIKPGSATVVTLQVQGASSGATLIQAVCAYL